MAEVKYRAVLDTLRNINPEDNIKHNTISKILGGNPTANALAGRYHADGYMQEEELEKLKHKYNYDFISNTKLIKVSDEEEDSILGDYYPEVFASCGSGCYTLSETKEPILIPKKCFKKPFSNVKKYSVIVARGDSMEPTIYDKDRLIVEHYETGEQIKDNSIYVFGYYNEIYVKRLIKNIDEIIIKSDNIDPIYKTKFIQKEEMNNVVVIGEIVGLIRDFR